MTGEERRAKLSDMLSEKPQSAVSLAALFGVSRQVIVQDVALLRAEGKNIIATNRGYILGRSGACIRVFKVRHSDSETRDELYAVVDAGGRVDNVFVHHKVYGTISAVMNIDSRRKADEFMEKIACGKSAFLKNITSDYHYHTISAESESVLDEINRKLFEKGFLVEKKRG